MNMKQKTRYFIFLILTAALIYAYVWDDIRVRDEVKEIQESLSTIDEQLKSGVEIMNEMNEIRQNFIENKNMLISYQISGSELLDEIERISDLANSMDIDIKNLEIDPRNTFPALNETMGKDQIKLERNSLNFQLSGNFLDVGNFIEILEENSSQVKLQNCSINLDSLDPRGVVAKLEYLTYGGAGQ